MSKQQIPTNYIYRFYGYQDKEEILIPTDKLFWSLEEISASEDFYPFPLIKISTKSKNEIKEGAKNFFKKHFTLHHVPYKNLLNPLDLKFMIHINDPALAAKLCNATNIHINPFSIPIKFTGIAETDTMVVTNGDFIDSEDFFKEIEISYRQIVLQKKVTEISESSYVHEITHTQLSKVKGIIKYYTNSEILPIFLELLNMHENASPNTELLGNIERFNELVSHLEALYSASMEGITVTGDLVSSTVYAESILKAYNLYLEYINGTPSLQKYILNSIQNVFNGDMQLEELLDEFEITIFSILEGNALGRHFKTLAKRAI